MISLTHQFLAWCRSKPADEEYDYWDFYCCPCTQFGNELGLLNEDQVYADSGAVLDLHYRLQDSLAAEPWTFGSLADRVERQLAEQGQVS